MHIVGGKGSVCSHLAVQRIASTLNLQQAVIERDELFSSLVNEWKNNYVRVSEDEVESQEQGSQHN